MPAAALAMVVDEDAFWQRQFSEPQAAPREHLASVTLRTGWNHRDLLTAVGMPRCDMGHLHADGGHVILGWEGRFWITDPGYQQYRRGLEREYTLGPQAHNAPVIAGVAQTQRATRLVTMETDDQQRQHVALDLTGNYEGLPAEAEVRRDVWLIPETRVVVVRDTFKSLPDGVEVQTHWLGATHLAWSFPGGSARLSDGERALWIVAAPGPVEPLGLMRHPGSRGPLTLRHVATLPQGAGTQWSVFSCDASAGWDAPRVTVEQDTLRVQLPLQPQTTHVLP